MSSYRAAGTGLYRARRPLVTELPLADVHPDVAWEADQDELWAAYEAEMRQDRLDDYAERPWPKPASNVVPFPVGERGQRKVAA